MSANHRRGAVCVSQSQEGSGPCQPITVGHLEPAADGVQHLGGQKGAAPDDAIGPDREYSVSREVRLACLARLEYR